MIKALAIAGALLLAAGCNSQAGASDAPEMTTIKGLISKLAPVMSCSQPYAEKVTGVRADCDGGKAFVEAFPDAGMLRLELQRVAAISVGQDFLVGDTWLAEADDPGQMHRMTTHLGGRMQHVGPTPMG